MDDPNKKVQQEETATDKNENLELSDDDSDNVAGGATFWFFDKEKRKPK